MICIRRNCTVAIILRNSRYKHDLLEDFINHLDVMHVFEVFFGQLSVIYVCSLVALINTVSERSTRVMLPSQNVACAESGLSDKELRTLGEIVLHVDVV